MKKTATAFIFLVLFIFPAAGSAYDDSVVTFRSNPVARKAVERNIALFTGDIRDRFSLYLSRSGKYLTLMKEILRENNVPEEIAFLALIESGFNPRAYSRSRAVGPWQFIAGTGRRYGLKNDWWVDERRDPVKSTFAATAYLNDLYDMFGSWSLAMAGYNAGEGKIRRALRRVKGDDYWDLVSTRYIKRETKNYVPKFLAALIIASDPAEFGFGDAEYEKDLTFDEVVLDAPADLDIVARAAGATVEEMRELNPELKRWCTPPNVDRYTLRIPEGKAEEFAENLAEVPEEKRFTLRIYRVRKGDTLSGIALKTGVPMRAILALNNIRKRSLLRIGQLLYIPTKGTKGLDKAELRKLRVKVRKLS